MPLWPGGAFPRFGDTGNDCIQEGSRCITLAKAFVEEVDKYFIVHIHKISVGYAINPWRTFQTTSMEVLFHVLHVGNRQIIVQLWEGRWSGAQGYERGCYCIRH